MKAFLAITRVTLRQLLGGKRLLLFGLLALLPPVVMLLASRDLAEVGEFGLLTPASSPVVDAFHDAPIAIVFLIVLPVVSLILGASTLGDERRDRTLSFLMLRPLRRSVITGAKLFAAWLGTTSIVSVSAALAAAVVGLRIGDWSYVGPVALAAAVSALAYTAVFMVLGYFTSRAVLLGLVYVFIWENGITFAAVSLANVSLFRIGLSAYGGLVPESLSELDEVLGSVAPGAGGAIAKALVIAVLAVFGSASLLRRRDLL
ncbi:MAG: ABC transporter permease [Actinomycetota bacterium]